MYIFSNKETGWKFVFGFIGQVASHMVRESSSVSVGHPLSPPLW